MYKYPFDKKNIIFKIHFYKKTEKYIYHNIHLFKQQKVSWG